MSTEHTRPVLGTSPLSPPRCAEGLPVMSGDLAGRAEALGEGTTQRANQVLAQLNADLAELIAEFEADKRARRRVIRRSELVK